MNNLNLKTHLAFIFFFFLFLSSSISQDLITTKDGEKIECKVLEIDLPIVKYRLKSQPDGPVINIASSNISTIEYLDGTIEFFKKAKKQIAKPLREYRPFSIGLSSGVSIIPYFQSASTLSFGYQLKKIDFRILIDGTFFLNYYAAFTTSNLSLHYILRAAKGKIEIFPEVGFGLLSYNENFRPTINLGLGFEYRGSNLISFFVHTRYQALIPSVQLNLGARFRFGRNKKKN